MSEILKIEKVISALPAQLDANTIYIVRVGTGYEMYVTDLTGAIAHKLNDEKITKLEKRRLNFKNILAIEPFDLTTDFYSFSAQTLQDMTRYEEAFPQHLGYDKQGIFQDQTYKLTIHYDYVKGSVQSGDKLKITLEDQDTGELLVLEQIDLSAFDSGHYTFEKEFTATQNWSIVGFEYLFATGADSVIKVLSCGCYDKSLIQDYDIFDHDLIIPYNYFVGGYYVLGSRINGIPDEVMRNNQQIRNQGVNLLHADYSNPQNSLYSYADYIFDVPWSIIPGFDKGVKSWEFDINNSTADSKVIFNLGGYGNDVLTPSLRLNRSKYIFSFYAKSVNAETHFIKFQLNSGIGIPYGVKEIEINAGVNQYIVLLDLPQLNYAVQFFLNSRGVDGTGKKILIERMMLEEISWQNFDANDSTYLPVPSQFAESSKNIGNVANDLTVEMREGFNSMNSWLNDLDNRKLDSSEYVQHFKGVFPSYTALQTAIPVAVDGDYAHIDSGQGFDRMGAIWDSSDNKWIVQSVNVGTNTDEVPEGSTNLYFKAQRVLDTVLTGLDTTVGTGILVTDKVLSALGKLQGQINTILSNFAISVRTTTLSGLSLSNPSKITSSDNVLTAFGKIQTQLNGISAGPMVWTDATTLSTPGWHSSIDQAKSKIEYSVYNGLVYVRGFITITTALGSAGGIVLFSHKDARFMANILFHTGFATFNIVQVTMSTVQGSAAANISIGQSTLSGDSQSITTVGAAGANLYAIPFTCLGPLKV